MALHKSPREALSYYMCNETSVGDLSYYLRAAEQCLEQALGELHSVNESLIAISALKNQHGKQQYSVGIVSRDSYGDPQYEKVDTCVSDGLLQMIDGLSARRDLLIESIAEYKSIISRDTDILETSLDMLGDVRTCSVFDADEVAEPQTRRRKKRAKRGKSGK